MRYLTVLLGLWLAISCVSCQSAPPADYARTAPVLEKRGLLKQDLLKLLPAEQQTHPEAQKEAAWLADTAYKAAVDIAILNDPVFLCWLNNRLVNSSWNWKERGLCWHYQHDLYRELRRKPLSYFALGCAVRDKGRGAEHHCVYVTPIHSAWPDAVILDAWQKNGRLTYLTRARHSKEKWQDEPRTKDYLDYYYPVGHNKPLEHWARVKSGLGMRDYLDCDSEEAKECRQGKLMYENMRRGLQKRGGKPVGY